MTILSVTQGVKDEFGQVLGGESGVCGPSRDVSLLQWSPPLACAAQAPIMNSGI